MKLWSGIAVSVAIFSGGELKRPEPFFTHQNIITYSIVNYPKNGGGEKQNAQLEIVSVVNAGSKTSSSGILTYSSRKRQLSAMYRMRFASDSANFYVYATNWSYETVDADKEGSVYSGDSLWYPYNMKIGDTLPDAWTLRETHSNDFSGKFLTEFKSRKVVSQDTIDTPFGKTVTFRIDMVLKFSAKYNSHYSGRNKNMDEITVSEYFSPEIGVVKTEYRDSEYGVTKIVMESYKK